MQRCGWAVAAAVIATGAQAQTPATPSAPVFLSHPTVMDTAHLKGTDTVVTLQGVQGWGGDPAHDLQSLLVQAGDKVTCQPHGDGTYLCTLPSGADVGELAVATGAAKALDDAPAGYKTQQSAAQSAHRGVWAADLPGPAILRHPTVQTTAEIAANGRVYTLDGLIGFEALFYTLQLQTVIDAHGAELSCQPKGSTGRFVCLLPDGTDIATVALLQGLARATGDAPPEYHADQAQAARSKRGFWFNPPQPVLTELTPAPQPGAEPAPQPGLDVVAPGNLAPELSYDDGIPVAVIGGVPAFFVFIKEIGWGYYDRIGNWHGAPASLRAELARAFPNGPPDQHTGSRTAGAFATNVLRGSTGTSPAGFIDAPQDIGRGGTPARGVGSALLRNQLPLYTRGPVIRSHPIAPLAAGRLEGAGIRPTRPAGIPVAPVGGFRR